jgi:hypothetical protein
MNITKIKIVCLVLASALLTFANCKKKKTQYQYPEDPKATTLTPKERLHGLWQVSDYTLNGNSIISKLDTFYNSQYRIEDVIFNYDQNSNSKKWILTITSEVMSHTYENAFEEPDQILIDNDNYCCKFLLTKWFITPFKYVPNASTKWTITKLYNKELNLITKTDTGEFKMFFKKTN